MKILLKPFEELVTVWMKLDDFQKARWKLTGTYVVIFFILLNLFTGALFFVLQKEEIQHAKYIESVWQKNELIFPDKNLTIIQWQTNPKESLSKEEVIDLQHILLGVIRKWILIIEGFLLVVAGFMSYFLSGKTLRPIQKKNISQRQFLSDVSHELKNPLSALKISIEVAKKQEQWKAKEIHELLSDFEEEIDRLTKITGDLLVLEQNNHKIKKTNQNISSIIHKGVESLSSLSQKRNITIQEKLEDFSLLAIKGDIERIVFNILHNAIKYSHPNGKINVSLSKMGTLTIEDFGIGIEKKSLPNIFNRFYKVDSARTFSHENGSGLGLSIVKKICNKNGWKISVKSKEKKGTKFLIQFT